jgi:hypothetical protein
MRRRKDERFFAAAQRRKSVLINGGRRLFQTPVAPPVLRPPDQSINKILSTNKMSSEPGFIVTDRRGGYGALIRGVECRLHGCAYREKLYVCRIMVEERNTGVFVPNICHI